MNTPTITPGASVSLIREPERHGIAERVYNHGSVRLVYVVFHDGFTELCTPQELTLD